MSNTVLISEAAIAQRTRELAAEIHRDYAAEGQLHMVCVLKGAFMFLSDLVRNIDMPVTLDFMALSSYANSTTSYGEVRLLKDLDSALDDADVRQVSVALRVVEAISHDEPVLDREADVLDLHFHLPARWFTQQARGPQGAR